MKIDMWFPTYHIPTKQFETILIYTLLKNVYNFFLNWYIKRELGFYENSLCEENQSNEVAYYEAFLKHFLYVVLQNWGKQLKYVIFWYMIY